MRKVQRKNRLPVPITNGNGRAPVINRGQIVPSIVSNILCSRRQILDKLIDPRRDLYEECGYPDTVETNQYRRVYDREGVATRVVNVFPDECWALDPFIYETEVTEQSEFEKAWEDLELKHSLYHYLHRIDQLSGIGRFGVLLLGLSDSPNLKDTALPLNEDGTVNEDEQQEYELMYVRAFDETLVEVSQWERSPTSPRHGLPTEYNLKLFDSTQQISADAEPLATSVKVHWTRIIHVADERTSSEVWGTPRLQSVFNRVLDIRKVLSGSGEMFWKGAFPGYSFELMPNLLGEVDIDTASMRTEFENYSNGLQRYLALTGVTAKSLSPQVASPKDHINSQIQSIAISKGVPVRVFIGSEEAKLASTQDARTWNKRVARRQHSYVTPLLVRPFVDRLIALGVLPAPAEETYIVTWPDLNSPTDQDKAQVAASWTEALSKYVLSGMMGIIPPLEFLMFILEIPMAKAKTILENSPDPTGEKALAAQAAAVQQQDAFGGDAGGANKAQSKSKPQGAPTDAKVSKKKTD